MNVLSLFDGMSCGRLALERAGIKVDRYYASEIDKYAASVSRYNWPDNIELGDVTKWQYWDIDWSSIDLLIGGSPCQSFSVAGKGEGFQGKSGLFYEYVNILNHIKQYNPSVKFLLENVKMKAAWKDIISQELGVEPVLINSALLSAQNRERFYWCNWQVSQPKDRGIKLKDVLEIDGEGHLKLHGTYRPKTSKSNCLDSNYGKGVDNHGQRTVVCNCVGFADIRHEWDKVAYNSYRKLTPLECERLQTLPDDYTSKGLVNSKVVDISNTRRYCMIGNGWTADVIAHILKGIK